MNRKFIVYLFLGLALTAGSATIIPKAAHALDPIFKDLSDTAIRGYDPVAYFTEGKPVRGKSEISHQWMGAVWHFSSKGNRDLFIANPGMYAPQYGGYCAWAVSEGYTAPISPKVWNIHNGKLYLNYSKGVQRQWEKDREGHINKADRNWPKLLK